MVIPLTRIIFERGSLYKVLFLNKAPCLFGILLVAIALTVAPLKLAQVNQVSSNIKSPL